MAWLTGWSKRQKLTIDHSKVDSDCSNFPVKVIVPSSNALFDTAQSDGNDVRFTASDGETLLKHEEEVYRAETASTNPSTVVQNASFNTEFDGVDDYYDVSSVNDLLSSSKHVYEVTFTADTVTPASSMFLLYAEFHDTTSYSWNYFKVRRVYLYIDTDGYVCASLYCRNNGDTIEEPVIKTLSTINSDTEYTARLEIDHSTNTFNLYLDGLFQASCVNSHVQTFTQVDDNAWVHLGAYYYLHAHTAYSLYAAFFDGTIHDYHIYTVDALTVFPASVHHVKIPTVSSSSATEFYMYYGKADASDASDATNVWDSDYELVMHMDDSLEDSTSNGNDGTNYGSTLGLASDGYYRSLDGVNDLITTPSVMPSTGDYTVEVMQSLVASPPIAPTLVCQNDTDFMIYANSTYGSASNNPRVYSGAEIAVGTSDLRGAGDSYLGLSNDSSNVSLFVNSTKEDTGTTSQTITDTTLYIGRRTTNHKNYYFEGAISEVRISSVPRSDAWIKATSNSLHNTLLSFGSEESAPTSGTPRVMVVWA